MQVLGDGGTSIDVLVDGSGSQTLVLLAGFPLTRKIWDESATRLARDYRVVRPDLRGTGASGVGDGPYLMESLAADVAAVLDALQCERASIAGHSLGGYVALAFARMFTERVERLALICSRLRADTEQEAQQRETIAQRVESGDERALMEIYPARLLSPTTRKDRPDVTERVEGIVKSANLRGSVALLRGMALRSASDDVAPDLTMPVLVLAGGEDVIVPLDEARRDADAFPHGTLAIARRSGHMPMLEEPAVTLEALSLWMGRMTPASASGS